MNWVNMPFQIVFSVKCFITNITTEGLLSFMNWFNKLIQSVILRKACITHSAFIFINWFKMSIQMFFLRNAAPQKLQLKGFFPSWTESMWLFMRCFAVKLALQILHFTGYTLMNSFNVMFKCAISIITFITLITLI